MSEARKLYQEFIAGLQHQAKANGTTVSVELARISGMFPERQAAKQKTGRSLAALLEQAQIEQTECRYYEWLANTLLQAMPSKRGKTETLQEQRQRGTKKSVLTRQMKAARRRAEICEMAIAMAEAGTPWHHIRKRIETKLRVSRKTVLRAMRGI